MDNFNSYSSLDKKDRTDFYIALAVIISVLGFILFFSFDSLFAKDQPLDIDQAVNEVRLDDTLIVEGVEYVPIQKELIKKKVVRSSDSQEVILDDYRTDSNRVMDKTIVPVGSLNVDNNIDEKETTNILDRRISTKNKIDIEDTLDYVSTVIEKVDTSPIESEKEILEQAPNNIETVNETYIDKSCIISIGLYRKEENAIKMLTRLEKAGYNAFVNPRGDKQQVQIYSTCSPQKLQNTLDNIRTNFASDAVVLIKKQ